MIAVPVSAPPAVSPPRRRAAASSVLAALVVVPFLLRLPLLERRGFGNDEFEHLHFAWSVSRGQVPYRDYFDHHTPALHFVLAPLFAFYRVETSSADAVAAVFAGRRVTWVFAGAALAAVFGLAWVWRGRRVAWTATVLLAGTWIFLTKTLEVRPDVPATALMLVALALALGGWRRLAGGLPGASSRFLLSGFALGAMFLFTQKTAFLLPGVALAELGMVAAPGFAAGRAARVRALAAQALGLLLPLAAALAWFWGQGALAAFFECNFAINARWPGLGPREFVLRFLADEPVFVALAMAGFLRTVPALGRAPGWARGEPLVALSLLSPLASLAVHPAVTFHYFLLFIPQSALYAGAGLVWVAEALAARTRRSADAALAVLAVLASLQPSVRFARLFHDSNWNALQGIRYVTRNSAPWETTFDGFSGVGLFRPQAFYHPYQHWHTLAIQTGAQRRHLAEALASGAALPKLVFWDHYLREGVPAETARFVEAHYQPAGPEPIRARVFDNGLGWWSDEGVRPLGWAPGVERSPHVLFGDGWRDPETVDGIPSRRTRGRGADLVVPVRDPGDFRVHMYAKAGPDGLPFEVELLVNGTSAGRVAVVPRWQEYTFAARAGDLRRGFNDFRLRLRAAGEARPDLAVATLTLERGGGVSVPLTPAAAGP